ncbi:hypothetical protein MLD52_19765 [Puniceicoccaceae bacterium K14]|nr:hypothetical protein [Puniceicoccaceae bacterium K14]
MKTIELVEVQKKQKSVLRQLLELYEYDLSPFTGRELNEFGYYGYDYLDYYWTEENRFAYFITVDEKMAGFVLVNDYCEIIDDPKARTIAEFFVMNTFRREGVGREVAIRVFDLFPGPWEVHQHLKNKKALLFWEKVIAEYVDQNYEKRIVQNDDGARQVILFNNDKDRNKVVQSNDHRG